MPELKQAQLDDLKLAISIIDHTSLEGKDTLEGINELCRTAIEPAKNLPSVASVCVYPSWVVTAKENVAHSTVKVTSVATGFPSGNTFEEVRLLETQMAIKAGADEIDMVISRGQLLMGNHRFVRDEIRKVREVCNGLVLKVILETGELQSKDLIKQASFIAMEEGADFIKTSTGKIQPAATPEVSRYMLEAILDFYKSTAKMVGFKAAGGIRKASEALNYLQLVEAIVGKDWIHSKLLRFGASSLTNNLVKAVIGIEENGYYVEEGTKTNSY